MFVFLLLLSVLSLHTSGKVSSQIDNKNNRLLERTLSAFESALDFYTKFYDLINFDSLLGVRVAQGSLRQILMDNSVKENVNLVIGEKYQSRIGKLYMTAEEIANKALPFVRENNAEEYGKFYKIIRKPWDVFNQFRKLNPKSFTKDKKLQFVRFDGITSDHCIHILLKESSGERKSSCNVTDSCWDFETQRDLGGYTPAHQILYFLFGLAEGCGNIFHRMFHQTARSKGVQDFFSEICSNILRSTQQLQDTSMSEVKKDLFMEQTLVCSLTGYDDFLNETYLEIVLGWQTDAGCFGNKVPERVRGPGRTLLFEKRLENGCLVHETGVGIALLGQYIRWILETRVDGSKMKRMGL